MSRRITGYRVAAHAHGAEGMKRAVLGGVTSIEHGTYMDDEIMSLMKEKGTWYVPTIYAGRLVADKATIEGYFPEGGQGSPYWRADPGDGGQGVQGRRENRFRHGYGRGSARR